MADTPDAGVLSDKGHFSWLDDPRLSRIIGALGADQIRFVGGCVRDSMIGRSVADIDACTPLLPECVIERLQAADIYVIPTGLKHGTVTAVSDGLHVEITTLRQDVDTDGRHATVAFTDQWDEDAKRRDFTMNALYCDAAGHIYDPTGGLDDLKAGRVRFIGDAETRITEDALRIMRFFRFHLRYGQGKSDPQALAACTKLLDKLSILSIERIRDEFLKILSHDAPQSILTLMRDMGVMPYILPQACWLATPITDMPQVKSEKAALVKLLLLIRREKSVVIKVCKHLKMANSDRTHLLNIIDCLLVLQGHEQKAAFYRCGYYYCMAALYDALVLLGQQDHLPKSFSVPDFPVSGQDLLAHGIAAGPKLGQTLRQLEEVWLQSHCQLTKEALLEKL